MKMEIFNFHEKQPRRGNVVCFSEDAISAAFYRIDGRGDVWGTHGGEWGYCCSVAELQDYGHYTHWARTDKAFNIKYDIPKDD